MDEHVHKWSARFIDWDDADGVMCEVCDAVLDDKEMNRRLNEYDKLEAKATAYEEKLEEDRWEEYYNEEE